VSVLLLSQLIRQNSCLLGSDAVFPRKDFLTESWGRCLLHFQEFELQGWWIFKTRWQRQQIPPKRRQIFTEILDYIAIWTSNLPCKVLQIWMISKSSRAP